MGGDANVRMGLRNWAERSDFSPPLLLVERKSIGKAITLKPHTDSQDRARTGGVLRLNCQRVSVIRCRRLNL